MHPEQLQDDLLVKYYLKWCTDEEEELVSTWLNDRVSNRLYFENLLASDKLNRVMQEVQKIDVDQKWTNFQQEQASRQNTIIPLYEPEAKPETRLEYEIPPAGSLYINLKRAIGIAAFFVLIAGLTVILLHEKTKEVIVATGTINHEKSRRIFELTAENSTDSVKLIKLPDESVVRLSPKSKFTYKELTAKNSRELSLSGKARFNIYKDASRPFTVFSGDLATTALGTEFTVSNVENDKTIVIRLYEGKVVIRSSSEAKNKLKRDYFLYPMQEFEYNNNSLTGSVRSFAKSTAAQLAAVKARPLLPRDNPNTPQLGRESWFMFNNQPLDQVFKQLSEMYEADIEYSTSDFAKIYLIGTFNKNDSLERILTQIAKLNDLKFFRKDNKYIIIK